MKLIIRSPLAIEAQEIELTDGAEVELRLADGTHLRLQHMPDYKAGYERFLARAGSPGARYGGLQIEPMAHDSVYLSIPTEEG